MLDTAGVMHTKQLGSERTVRRLQQVLLGGEHPIRHAVWALIRPMLSLRLAELNRRAFVVDAAFEQTADLELGRAASLLDELDLGRSETDEEWPGRLSADLAGRPAAE